MPQQLSNLSCPRTTPPTEQLNQITSLPQSTSHEGRSGIDLLYTQVLKQAVDDVDVDDEETPSHFRTVVGAVLLVFNPLSIKALSDLLRVSGISPLLSVPSILSSLSQQARRSNSDFPQVIS
jgi:hypothetical protein